MERRELLKLGGAGAAGGLLAAAPAAAGEPGPMRIGTEPSPGWQAQAVAVMETGRLNLIRALLDPRVKFKTRPAAFSPAQLVAWRVNDEWGKLIDYFLPYVGPITGGERLNTLDGYRDLFVHVGLPRLADDFEKDEVFAENFVAGPDPTRLVRMASVPAKFPLTDAHLNAVPELASEDLRTAMNAGRVYWIDYEITSELQNGRHPSGPKYMYSPMIAFCVPAKGGPLRPFAVQCGQDPVGRRIYTPADRYSWKIAKNCVLVAHNVIHELLTHLGQTHLVADALLKAAIGAFQAGHPVARLLSRHFAGTPFINSLVPEVLTKPGGWVEVMTAPNLSSLLAWTDKHRVAYSFLGSRLPAHLERSETGDPRTLPYFPYRDDGLPVWKAIAAWTGGFVDAFYGSDARVRADGQLQAWAKAVHAAGTVRDFGATPGGIGDRQDLADILAMTLWIAGPQHAAVNFSQFDFMGFLPANPLAGFTPEPHGTGHTRQDWLDNLPPVDVALTQLGGLNVLSGVREGIFGDYGSEFEGTAAAGALREFTRGLYIAEEETAERNRKRARPYEYLKPSQIPNSINI